LHKTREVHIALEFTWMLCAFQKKPKKYVKHFFLLPLPLSTVEVSISVLPGATVAQEALPDQESLCPTKTR